MLNVFSERPFASLKKNDMNGKNAVFMFSFSSIALFKISFSQNSQPDEASWKTIFWWKL